MQSNDLLARGFAALKAGDRLSAQTIFTQVVKVDPQSEQGWLGLGLSQTLPDRKQYCFQRVLALNPNNKEARQGLASLTALTASPSPSTTNAPPPVSKPAPSSPARVAPVLAPPPPPQPQPAPISEGAPVRPTRTDNQIKASAPAKVLKPAPRASRFWWWVLGGTFLGVAGLTVGVWLVVLRLTAPAPAAKLTAATATATPTQAKVPTFPPTWTLTPFISATPRPTITPRPSATATQPTATKVPPTADERVFPVGGIAIPIQSIDHIAVGQPHEPYNSEPPTSGPHYAYPTSAGFYTEEIPDEHLVHSLEHGYIVIYYNCAKVTDVDCATVQKQLRIVTSHAGVSSYTGTPKIIVVPRPGLDTLIALTAWGRLDKFNDYNDSRILTFILQYRDTLAREPNVP